MPIFGDSVTRVCCESRLVGGSLQIGDALLSEDVVEVGVHWLLREGGGSMRRSWLEGAVPGACGRHAVLEAEVGDEHHDRLAAFVSGETDMVCVFDKALSCRVALRGAGPVGAAVERRRCRPDQVC
jgi:hypothetical protein